MLCVLEGPLSVHVGSNLAFGVKNMNFLITGQCYHGIIFWYRTPLSVIYGACNKGKCTPPPQKLFSGKWLTLLFMSRQCTKYVHSAKYIHKNNYKYILIYIYYNLTDM